MTASDARRLALLLLLLAVAVVLTVFTIGDGVFNGGDLLAIGAWALFAWAGWKL